jgi:transposase
MTCYWRAGGMITMDQYEYVRIAHRVYGKSVRQIQRETGHDRKTIRKALRNEPFRYAKRVHQPCGVIGPYREVIDGWLEADQEVAKKQRHTARRIYHRLVSEQSFSGSEVTVRRYVRGAKIGLGISACRAFIPLDPDCGQEAEVDWGSAEGIISGERVRMKFFCMRSKYSGKHFVRCYPCERQQAFFDAHLHAFDFYGGIFPTLIYDNLTSAVQRVLKGKNRIEQEAFRNFRTFYNFSPRFCNPGSGHEKGGVEGMVGFVRRNYMVPLPEAQSFEVLNERLLKDCLTYGQHRVQGQEKTVNELFEEEKSKLIARPAVAFSNIQAAQSKVNAYSTVLVDKNHYSVPTRYVGLRVQVLLGVDEVRIHNDNKKIATHRRVFGNNKWKLDPDHYLELLQQRPAAFDSARPIREWRKQWSKSLERLLEKFQASRGSTDGIKDFISVLMLYRDHGAEDVDAAVELALERGISASSGVKHILVHSTPGVDFAPLSNWPATLPADVSIYGQLGGLQ